MGEDTNLNVFVLTLPLQQKVSVKLSDNGIEETMQHKDNQISTQENLTHPYTLLLVEDNVQMVEYEKRCLEKDYNIITATDGEEALLKMQQHNVNLVITDVMMEPMDGIELCRSIKYGDYIRQYPKFFDIKLV